MKQWKYTLAARIVAGVLFLIFAMGTLLGAGACVALYEYNAFNDGGQELFDAAADYLMDYREVSTLQHLFESNWSYWGNYENEDKSLPYELMPNHTNFRFIIFNDKNEELLKNDEGYMSGSFFAKRKQEWSLNCAIDGEMQKIVETYPTFEKASQAGSEYYKQLKSHNYGFNVGMNEAGEYTLTITYVSQEFHTISAVYGIDASLPVLDRYSVGLTLVNTLIVWRYWAVPLTILSLVLTIALFIFLLVSAGHRTGTAEVSRNWFDRVPLELVLLGMGAVAGGAEGVLSYRTWTFVGLFLPLLLALGLLFCMTFAARCKTKTLAKGTILYWICHWAWAGMKWVWYVLKNLSLIWKTILIWGGLCLVELVVVIGYGRGPLVIFWFLEKLLLTPALFAFVIGLKKLQDGAARMAAGDMSPVPERYLFPSEKQHAQSLNSMGRGAVLAAEKQLKSERMKTELITNVSHDLKTPLTSLISYVDLLKKEGLDSQHAPEYLEVLDRQSQRLKKLTEDLVEASKASTGNIRAELEDTDVNMLLSQAAGEYAERLSAADLMPVLTLDPAEPHILADGRLLWRVFDNLLSNVTKYALPGTRVYLTTEAVDGHVRITFRNVSREPLNISAEELMERFVRGDASRNTEGSGLGLSIAKSLTELNGGSLELVVDGDLFKAVLVF